VSNR